MSKRKKQTGRYIVEINDWGCGTMIKDTLTGKEIDAPAEETVNLCLAEMNRLSTEVERLRKAGDELAWAFSFAVSKHDGEPSGLVKAWHAAKDGKQS